MAAGPMLVQIKWVANPFRGDAFEEAWRPIAAAALDYGATHWALYRNSDGRLDFLQEAIFPSKAEFERYWYSEEVSEARARVAGLYQVPLLPTYWDVAGSGTLDAVRD